ncbi:selenium-dependent molybdenum cofactor biosynthesis protein YqeB [Tissierella carlieri]|jgi:xanthine dehydrogenase accessory factor|uniref:selenium-dependent molybdenum cofactor biosynthesis protein YqeB n=1 Tax=Tissierella TaxID=41273 RepID=UPI00280391B5|nr:selenium-dependent molybdenum cofactor biosynthesis protein YqeB [uncultured Tissierella sp.]MDU5081137.1 selenium-dependent molybdenum cofactor biosynthesis protein YqeB [Bacillota bacterium]
MKNLIVIRGGGDLATGIAHRLFRVGYKVVIIEVEQPLAIRRTVAFCEAVYSGEIIVEGVKAVFSRCIDDIKQVLRDGNIPVYIDKEGDVIGELKPLAVVDAIIAKKNLGTKMDMAPITIGVGPGFEAGVDVNLVIESNRGHNLGRVIYSGSAEKNTGIPGETMGYREERIIRASDNGIIRSFFNIGDMVRDGDVVCRVGNIDVKAQISGILRGMIKEGMSVYKGLKIGDIDPRGIRDYAFTISDKARAIGGGVLEGIQYLQMERRANYGRFICNEKSLSEYREWRRVSYSHHY